MPKKILRANSPLNRAYIQYNELRIQFRNFWRLKWFSSIFCISNFCFHMNFSLCFISSDVPFLDFSSNVFKAKMPIFFCHSREKGTQKMLKFLLIVHFLRVCLCVFSCLFPFTRFPIEQKKVFLYFVGHRAENKRWCGFKFLTLDFLPFLSHTNTNIFLKISICLSWKLLIEKITLRRDSLRTIIFI